MKGTLKGCDMENIDDDTEKFIDESMPFIFDRLGDTTALTKHGCLTVAQCALLMPAMLTENRPGDSSEIAAHYMQLALLDIAEGELSPKHPETLIPYSQYLRMMESGMYGVKGESLPLPTLDWLVSLDEATQWLKSKGIDINLDGLMAELGDGNTAPEQEATTPASELDYSLLATRSQLLDAFQRWGMKAAWFDDLNSRTWLLDARRQKGQGQRGHVIDPLFCPYLVMLGLIGKVRKANRLPPGTAWRTLEHKFPKVYAAFEDHDPRDPTGD
jgi:hypothetical protein